MTNEATPEAIPETPPGTIGLVCVQETARWAAFWEYWAEQAILLSTDPAYDIGCGVYFDRAYTYDVASGRNQLIERAMERGSPWVLFLDDDQTASYDVLPKLITRGVDIVQPLTLRRQWPFPPLPTTETLPTGERVIMQLTNQSGLVPVQGLGGGHLFVRRKVFETVPYPWFEAGVVSPGHAGEDTAFCDAAIRAGFQPYVDCDNVCEHFTTARVKPHRRPDGSWVTRFCIGPFSIDVPAAQRIAASQYAMKKVEPAKIG